MTRLIAETAWHHEGDFLFMKDLITKISTETQADIVKMHITLDLDEYMRNDHDAYETLKKWMLSEEQWSELIGIVRANNKALMLLVNDTKSIEFAAKFNPELIELHSVCVNVPRLQRAIINNFSKDTEVVVGVGGCDIKEVDAALYAFEGYKTILMFGFQNYPTKYEDVALKKIRKIQSLYADNCFGYADHTGWDEKNNELITLLVSSNGMSYVEKHVTTQYGVKRCDFSAAISIEMFNSLAEKLKISDAIAGDGALSLNSGERAYSQYGPMKMAPVAVKSLPRGHCISESDITYARTAQITDISQVDFPDFDGSAVTCDIQAGTVINRASFK